MNSRNSFYLPMIVGLVVLLVASFIWLNRATPAVAARGPAKLKTVGASAWLEHTSPVQTALDASPGLARPPLLPSRQPLLQGSPVITVTKSSVNEDGDPLRPGERITYTITISNSGSVSATNVVVSDTFPANTSFIAGSISITPALAGGTKGTLATQPVIASGITVTAGSLVTVTYAVNADSPLVDGTEIVNTASITSSEVATPAMSTVIDTVTNEADLSISKTNGQATTVPGESTTYTIVVSNTGPSDVTGAIVTDSFPAALTGVTWTCSSSGGGSCSAGGSGNINDTVNLPVGGSLTYMASGTVASSAVGTLTNTATVTVPTGVADSTPSNNNATDSDTLTPEADLGVTKADSPDPVIAGNTLTYNLTVFNNGPSDAPEVRILDNIIPSSGGIFDSAVPSQGNCTIPSNVVCNLGTIASGNTVTATIQVIVDPSFSGGLLNIANVEGLQSDDPIPGNDTASEQTIVELETDLAISKSDSPDPVAVGESLIYTLNITNNGPSNATGVVVTDTLPGGVNFVSAVPSQGSSCTENLGTVVCNLGNLPKQGNATVTITVNPQTTGPLNNSATVAGNETDLIGINNSDDEDTTVNTKADLSVSKTSSPNPVLPGDDLTYDITVTNNGPSTATGVVVTDPLPGEVTFVSVTPTPECSETNGTVTCNLGSLASGNNVTVEIIVTVDPSIVGTLSNTATVSSSTSDPNSSNNTDPENTTVGDFEKVYLPIVFHPGITDLSIHNDSTGGNVTFTVLGTGVSCTVPNNTTQFCGSFPAGTYSVQAVAPCGSSTTSKTYGPGPVTTRIFCQ